MNLQYFDEYFTNFLQYNNEKYINLIYTQSSIIWYNFVTIKTHLTAEP